MKISISIALVVAIAALAAPTAAARPCGDAVVADWADGRIDGRYAPSCYGKALESLPEDVLAYSTAADDISRALQARIRATRASRPPRSDAAASDPALLGSADLARLAASVPLPLLLSAAVTMLLGLFALVGLVTRRLRRPGVHHGAQPAGQW